MNKVLQMKNAISEKAFIALGHSGRVAIGGVVQLRDADVMVELRRAGIVGHNDGLTIIGSGVAAMAQEFVYDLAF